MTDPTPTPISGDDARRLLDDSIRQQLGPTWDDPETGWSVISRHDFMARLTNGKRVLDFYVDLLGEVRVEEKPVTTEDRGRIAAWIIAALILMAALYVAQTTNFFGWAG